MTKTKIKENEILKFHPDNYVCLVDEKTGKKDYLIRSSVIEKHLKRIEHRLESLKGTDSPSPDWIDATENQIMILKEVKGDIYGIK